MSVPKPYGKKRLSAGEVLKSQPDAVGAFIQWLTKGRKGCIDDVLDRRNGAETGTQVDLYRAPVNQQISNLIVETNIGTSEAVDRLLRITYDEQFARCWRDLAPVADGRIRGREQHQDFRLKWVGVLELINEDVSESLLQVFAH